jgi:hypothetical protein
MSVCLSDSGFRLQEEGDLGVSHSIYMIVLTNGRVWERGDCVFLGGSTNMIQKLMLDIVHCRKVIRTVRVDRPLLLVKLKVGSVNIHTRFQKLMHNVN